MKKSKIFNVSIIIAIISMGLINIISISNDAQNKSVNLKTLISLSKAQASEASPGCYTQVTSSDRTNISCGDSYGDYYVEKQTTYDCHSGGTETSCTTGHSFEFFGECPDPSDIPSDYDNTQDAGPC